MDATEKIIDYILERLHLLESINDDLTAENDYQRTTIDQLENLIRSLDPRMNITENGRHYISFGWIWEGDKGFKELEENFINK